MRGETDPQPTLFYSFQIEDLIAPDHPLRAVKKRADAELARLEPKFRQAYAATGRPSTPPETLIKASLLQALYSIRSERQLCEQIRYNMLFRWFLDLRPDAAVFDHSVFSKNRRRLGDHGLMRAFFDGVVARAIEEEAASHEHFSVDGTLMQAWASMKSFRPKDETDDDGGSNAWSDFRGHSRSNATHRSKTDPEARLFRKGLGKEARLSHSLHALMDNRATLIMDMVVDQANGTAERQAALAMLDRARRQHPRLRPATLGADKGYDTGEFLDQVQTRGVTPHVAPRATQARRSPRKPARKAVYDLRMGNRRRSQTPAHRASQAARRRIEEIFAWIKDIAGLRRAPFVGRWKTQLAVYAAASAWNLMRLGRLCAVG